MITDEMRKVARIAGLLDELECKGTDSMEGCDCSLADGKGGCINCQRISHAQNEKRARLLIQYGYGDISEVAKDILEDWLDDNESMGVTNNLVFDLAKKYNVTLSSNDDNLEKSVDSCVPQNGAFWKACTCVHSVEPDCSQCRFKTQLGKGPCLFDSYTAEPPACRYVLRVYVQPVDQVDLALLDTGKPVAGTSTYLFLDYSEAERVLSELNSKHFIVAKKLLSFN